MPPPDSEFDLVLQRVVAALDAADIAHYVGGSVASSRHGMFRSTADIDIVARITPESPHALCRQLADELYADPDTAAVAAKREEAFHLIHLQHAVKVDVFSIGSDALSQSALARAERSTDGVRVATAEDIVLAKLRWYRRGGDRSERQWNDLLGVLRVQAGGLDSDYLDRWAATLGVADLLARLRRET